MKWWDEYKESTKQTKYFILTWVFYGLIIILSCFYSYARLDYVRSYPNTTMKGSTKPTQPTDQPQIPGQETPSK